MPLPCAVVVWGCRAGAGEDRSQHEPIIKEAPVPDDLKQFQQCAGPTQDKINFNILGSVVAGGRYFNAAWVSSACEWIEQDIDADCSIEAGPHTTTCSSLAQLLSHAHF